MDNDNDSYNAMSNSDYHFHNLTVKYLHNISLQAIQAL